MAQAAAAARLLRRSGGALRGRAARRLLCRGTRLRAPGELPDDPQRIGRPRVEQLLAHAVPEILPHHRHERGPAARLEPLLPRRLAEENGAACRHRVLPCALPAGASRQKRRQAVRVPGRAGPRVYAGTVLSVVQAEAGWFGEGDERFFVDGQKKASIEGTGTEDYFNDAWGLHVEEGPYFGVPVAEGTGLGSRMTGYRWHIDDPIPFTSSLRFEIEHKGWTFEADGSVKSAFGERTDLMSSVAFWYQDGIARGSPPRALRFRATAAGKRASDRGGEVARRGARRARETSLVQGSLLVEGCPALRSRGARREDRGSVRRAGRRRLRALCPDGAGLGLRRLHRAARREGAVRRDPRARAGRGREAQTRRSTVTRRRRTSATTTRSAGRG